MHSHNPYQPLRQLDVENNNYSDFRHDQAKKPATHPASLPRRQEYKETKYPSYKPLPQPLVQENNNQGSQPPQRYREYEQRRPYGTNDYNPSSNRHYRNYDDRKRQQPDNLRETQNKRSRPSHSPSSEPAYKRTQYAGQPHNFFQTKNELKKTVVDQQMKIEKLEKTIEEQEQTVLQKNLQMTQLQQELQKLQEKRIKETISEKTSKHMSGSASTHMAASGTSAFAAATSSQAVLSDYSQAVLLRRINLYLESVHKEKISEKGYCHGLALLWLTMMSWGVEKLFYEMIKTIADCPLNQLAKIDNTILRFLDWIEVGQYPGKYSNKADAKQNKGEITQQNVDEIIGDVQKIFAGTKSFTPDEMAKELKELTKENNMISVTGWWVDKNTGKEEGHTVGVFIRGSQYHFYDPNFKTLGHLQFTTETALVDQIWERVFKNLGVTPGTHAKFSLNAVHRPEPVVSYKPTFFCRAKAQPSIPGIEPEYGARPMMVCN